MSENVLKYFKNDFKKSFGHFLIKKTFIKFRNDAKTVNVIAEACFHQITKIKVTAIQFFLGSNQDRDDDDSSEDEKELPNIKRLQHVNQINKTKKSKKRKLEKALLNIRKKELQKHRVENFNFSALHLLNDPQGNDKKKKIKFLIRFNPIQFNLIF